MEFLDEPKARLAFLIESQMHQCRLVLPQPGYGQSFPADALHELFGAAPDRSLPAFRTQTRKLKLPRSRESLPMQG